MSDTSPTSESNNETPQKKAGMPVGFIATSAIVLAVVGIVGYKMTSSSGSETQNSMTQDLQTDSSATSTPTTIEAANYKDGTYDVKGAYTSPGGPETIDVKLTLKDNTVTEAEVISEATLPKSKFMQGAFIDGYKEFVVGKKLNDIHLEKVSGSSLTPMGFNDALEKIKAQATQAS